MGKRNLQIANPSKCLLGEAFDLSTTPDFYEFIIKISKLYSHL